MKYYERLKQLREDNDLTQKQIAEIINCTQTAYSKYEKGQREISIDNLIKLIKFYEVSADYILGISNIQKQEYKTKNKLSINGKNKINRIEMK